MESQAWGALVNGVVRIEDPGPDLLIRENENGFRLLQRPTVFRSPEFKLHIGPIGEGPLPRRVLVFLYR